MHSKTMREEAMKVFSNGEIGSLRAISDENGDAWFMANDVCQILELNNVSRAMMRLDEDEKTYITNRTAAGKPTVLTVGWKPPFLLANVVIL